MTTAEPTVDAAVDTFDATDPPGGAAPRRRIGLWASLLVLGALAAVVSAPMGDTAVPVVLFAAVGIVATAALVVSVIRRRPEHPWVWLAFAAANVLIVAATVLAEVQWSDDPDRARAVFLTLQLSGQVMLVIAFCGVARLRRRSGDISTILDALILGLAIGLFTWRSLLIGAIDSADIPALGVFAAMVVPGLDVVVCTALLRRAFSAVRTTPAFRMIMVAAGLLATSHLVAGLSALQANELDAHVPFQIGYVVLIAAAATHPSMRHVTEPVVITENKFGVTRIALLALALLITPLVILLDREQLASGSAPLLVGVFAMSVIVVIRLISLAGEMEQTRQRERRREQRFESLVRNSTDLIIVLDPNLLISYSSPAANELMGYAPAELLGRSALQGIHPDDAGRVKAILERLAPEATSELDLIRILHANGSWRWVEVRAVNLIGDPTVKGIVANCRDVTERMIAQEQIQASVARQSAIGGLGRVALAAPDTSTLTERAAALIRATLSVRRCEILLLDRGHVADAVVATAGASGGLEVRDRPTGAVLDACLDADEPVAFVDADPDGPLSGDPDASRTALAQPAQGWSPRDPDPTDDAAAQVLAVQVADSEQVIGVIFVRSGDPRTFTTEEADFLATMAGTLGLALGRRNIEATAQHQALHDSLTGLPNRALFVDRLDLALARMARSDQRLAVLFLDIDHFKVINDSLGHSIGDRILTTVAERLQALLRPGDTVARFGGDEFTVLLDPLSGRAEAETIAERIRNEVARATQVGTTTLQPTVSVGIAVASAGTSNAETLLRDADAAMYQAKDRGRNKVAVFDDTIRDRVIHRLQTEIDLPRAISDGQLVMRYQPVVALADGTAAGLEALVRWKHPELGEIPPSQFIPIAELSGLIGDLDLWVMRNVMIQCAQEYRSSGDVGRWYALNVSARTIAGTELPARVAETLAETGAPPEKICLEITESALMQDLEHSIDVLRALRALGVGIAVDDFGTGYSSLSYLKRLPTTVLKIDGSFVAGLGVDHRDRAIVESVVRLATTLHQQAIAEGVETRSQVEALIETGCPLAQGFYFGRPVDAADLDGAPAEVAREVPEGSR